MPAAITVNGVDLRSLGFIAEPITGPWDVPEVQDPVAAVPGRAGSLVLASRASVVQPRRLEIPGHLVGDTLVQRDTFARRLAALCAAGVVELVVAGSPAVMYVARLASIAEAPYPRQYRAGRHGSRFTLTFQALDSWGYDTSVQSVAVQATPVPVPLGAFPSAPVLLLLGAATNPTVTYCTAGGVSRCVMGFTITLGANDFLTVDCDAQIITKTLAGSGSNAMDTWTTTADGMLVLDPADGDPLTGVWPTVEVSAGAGLVLYRRAW